MGFIERVRAHARFFRSHDTGRNRARQVLQRMASVKSLTANEKPRQNASRSPRFINSVSLSLNLSIIFCYSVSVADNIKAEG